MSNAYGFAEVEPEFLAVMASTIRVYRAATPDVYGKTTTAATPTCEVPAYYEDQGKTYTTPSGETRQTTGKAYLGYVVPWLSTADRIDVPDLASATGWKTTVPTAVDAVYGPAGVHHQEIVFGPRDQGTPQ